MKFKVYFISRTIFREIVIFNTEISSFECYSNSKWTYTRWRPPSGMCSHALKSQESEFFTVLPISISFELTWRKIFLMAHWRIFYVKSYWMFQRTIWRKFCLLFRFVDVTVSYILTAFHVYNLWGEKFQWIKNLPSYLLHSFPL